MNNNLDNSLLVETSWEVCNQLGGIYTVIRSKAPSMVNAWGNRYCLLGPYVHNKIPAEFEPSDDYSDEFGKAVIAMRELGFIVHYGYWLVVGKPKVILLDFNNLFGQRLAVRKFVLWEKHGIDTSMYDDLVDQTIAFGEATQIFIELLVRKDISQRPLIAHFHEWMVGTSIPELKVSGLPVSTVFTTHATQLGRFLAMNDPWFYDHLPFVDWYQESIRFNCLSKVLIERSAAINSGVFTTVSDVTALECVQLLGRKPDVITPNGLNIERFVALHEFQNLHTENKKLIHEFVMGHFFQNYSFDVDKTLYFFTSGRFEFSNKGFDISIEALARLNYKMQNAGINKTVVMFFITKQPYHSISPHVLNSRGVLEEIHQTCKEIEKQLGEKLFYAVASSAEYQLPNLNAVIDDYWKLRLHRTYQSWKNDNLPPVLTHNLVYPEHDQILNTLKKVNLLNHEYDKVKVVYHPDFISPTNPLFGMEYSQFIRGCHLGVFPSYYEPWGYTPLECIASGIPSVTSDLSGFGDYINKYMPEHDENGIYVVERRYKNFNEAAEQLADILFGFVKMNMRDRINERNKVENSSEFFDWKYLYAFYEEAYVRSLKLTTEIA